MVIVEQTLNEEKVKQLLAEGGESELLDFKRTLDLNETSGIVEFAKDIAAMQVEGGYIVVGADDFGKPTGEFSAEQAKLFDEARLRSKLTKYLPEPLSLRTCVLQKEGTWLAAVVTLPNPSGYMIIKADGQYGSGKDQRTVFRAGEVFVRHGSASERWSQHDTERIIRRVVENRKEEWRRENTEAIMSAIEAGGQGRIVTQGAAAALTWRLDAASFNQILIESLRANDTVPVVVLLDQMMQDALSLFTSRDEDALDEMRTLLNRLACAALTLLRFDRFEPSALCVKTLLGIYMSGFLNVNGDVRTHQGNIHAVSSPQLWLEIVKRVVAVGAYATRRENWKAVRLLSLQTVDDRVSISYGEKQFWLRHAIMQASIANIFSQPQTRERESGELISYANQIIEGESCLRPDLPLEDYRLLRSVLEFDLLAVLIVSHRTKSFDNSFAYASFIYWGMQRVEAVLGKLLSDKEFQAALFGAAADEDFLAEVLREIQQVASHSSRITWSRWSSRTITKFMSDNPRQETNESS